MVGGIDSRYEYSVVILRKLSIQLQSKPAAPPLGDSPPQTKLVY